LISVFSLLSVTSPFSAFLRLVLAPSLPWRKRNVPPTPATFRGPFKDVEREMDPFLRSLLNTDTKG
jgi:hypothetical protein